MPLPDLGELLAKHKKARWSGKWPTLTEIMGAQKTKNSRRVKAEILKGMRRIFPEDLEAEKNIEEIFARGKAHPSADRLYGVGSDLGMMYLAGIGEGWPSLEDIMAECHVKTRALAKKYMMPGFAAVLGNEEGEIAWDRIFPQIKNANLIRFEARTIGWQQKLGTLQDPDTLAILGAVFDTTYVAAIRDLFIETLTDMFGEKEGKELYADVIPYTLKPEIKELLRLEGRQLAELWFKGDLTNILTLTYFMNKYKVRGRDVVGRYIFEGMQEILGFEDATNAYDDCFSQKRHLGSEQKDGLRDVGQGLGHRYENGERTTTHVLYKLMDKFGVKDIRTAERHILAGLVDVLGKVLGEIALETFFSNVHPNAEAIRQLGRVLAQRLTTKTLKEYKSIKDIAKEKNAAEETASKYLFEGVALEVGEKRAQKVFQKIFPHDLHALLGAYNHPILEAGLEEVIKANFEKGKPAPAITTEKFEETVKHDVLIENIQVGDWFRHHLTRVTPQNETFLEALKLTGADGARYKRISVDFQTREDLERVVEKDEKYADEDTLLLIALTNYNDPVKEKVIAPQGLPNTRIVSAELAFRLFGANTAAIKAVQKVRDLTRQGKVEELRAWMEKVSTGTAPSFVVGQQSLDQWLHDKNETEGQEQEADPGETKKEGEDAGEESADKEDARAERDVTVTGNNGNENAGTLGENGPTNSSPDQEQPENATTDQRQPGQQSKEEESRIKNPKVETGEQARREPEKVQESVGQAETSPRKHPGERTGMGQDASKVENHAEEWQAELGNIALILVPPAESSPQEMMLGNGQKTSLANEVKEAGVIAPPEILENPGERITPDMEPLEQAIEASTPKEQEQGVPAIPDTAITEQRAGEAPAPQAPITDTPTPIEPPATEVEDPVLKDTKEGSMEGLPAAPQTPVEDTLVLEEPLTESPLIASAEIAEYPTGDGKNPSELDVPLLETALAPEEKIQEMAPPQAEKEEANAEVIQEEEKPTAEHPEPLPANPEEGSKTPEFPDPLAEMDAENPYEMPAEDACMNHILEQLHEYIAQHPEIFDDKKDLSEYPDPVGEIITVPFDKDQADALSAEAEINGDPEFINWLQEGVVNHDGQEVLDKMDLDAEAAREHVINAWETPVQAQPEQEQEQEQEGPEVGGADFEHQLPSVHDITGLWESLDQNRQDVVGVDGLDREIKDASDGSEDKVDELMQDALGDGGPELLHQLDQEALDPANQLPEVPEIAGQVDEKEIEPTQDATDKSPEVAPAAPAGSPDAGSNQDQAENETPESDAPDGDDPGDSLERQTVLPLQETGEIPQKERIKPRETQPPEILTLDGPRARPDIPDYDHLFQKQDLVVDIPNYDRAPGAQDSKAEIPDYDHLPGDGHTSTDLPDYDHLPEEETPAKDIPDYDAEPGDAAPPKTEAPPEESESGEPYEGRSSEG